ncbi:MAG: amino acid adenylation domain-containing protein [Nannocystaceae bacterium]
MRLEQLVKRNARRMPGAPAVRASDGQATYGELDALADDIAHCLLARGVGHGDRVAIWLDKGLMAAATMQAVLRLGAAYVPMDPLSPPARIKSILDSCSPRAIVSTARRLDRLDRLGPVDAEVLLLDRGIPEYERFEVELQPLPVVRGSEDDLAYILFTSGSTGTPKGVCISHRNALAFVLWAAETVDARPEDRFANHAPFHFDLSVFDLYVAFLVGACVCIVPEGLSFTPTRLVGFMRDEQISVWYSVPSVLVMMMQAGRLIDGARVTPPRVLIFAGEAFAVPPLARLRAAWPRTRFFNFYGPTETNVCTAYELPEEPPTAPVPIGTAASDDLTIVITDDGREAGIGEEGELHIEGPTVMLGYWGQPPQGRRYATGDRVLIRADGQLAFLGRKDKMVKVRGNRVELSEIEHVLMKHPAVRMAAVTVTGEGASSKLIAYLEGEEGHARPSLLGMKKHCADFLPRYMLVDHIDWIDSIPLTRNGKRDWQALSARSVGSAPTRQPAQTAQR